jgi:hypothetical protein
LRCGYLAIGGLGWVLQGWRRRKTSKKATFEEKVTVSVAATRFELVTKGL